MWCTNKRRATITYGHINEWDVGAVSDFRHLFSFSNCPSRTFNENIADWDVSSGTLILCPLLFAALLCAQKRRVPRLHPAAKLYMRDALVPIILKVHHERNFLLCSVHAVLGTLAESLRGHTYGLTMDTIVCDVTKGRIFRTCSCTQRNFHLIFQTGMSETPKPWRTCSTTRLTLTRSWRTGTQRVTSHLSFRIVSAPPSPQDTAPSYWRAGH